MPSRTAHERYAEERAWVVETAPTVSSVKTLCKMFADRFGHDKPHYAMHTMLWQQGVSLAPMPEMPSHCERRVTWKSEPEMSAWMDGHDYGQKVAEISAAFREEFGFALTRGQVCAWRSANGRQQRRSPRTTLEAPLGKTFLSSGRPYRKYRKNGEPGRRSGWDFVDRHVWEDHHGPIPSDMVIVHCDRNPWNCDVRNLRMVPIRVMSTLSKIGWHDADSLDVAVAMATLKVATNDLNEKTTGRRLK